MLILRWLTDSPALPTALAASSVVPPSDDSVATIADELLSKWLSDDAEIAADPPEDPGATGSEDAMPSQTASVAATRFG